MGRGHCGVTRTNEDGYRFPFFKQTAKGHRSAVLVENVEVRNGKDRLPGRDLSWSSGGHGGQDGRDRGVLR